MKRVIVLMITVAMILSLATSVSAATAYLDTGINGKAATGSSQWNTINSYLFGIKVPINDWFVSLDCATLTAQDSLNSQVWNYELKGGYSFINNDYARITPTLGYYYQNINNAAYTIQVSAITLGLDSEFKIVKNLYLGAEVDCAVAGKNYQETGTTPDTLNSVVNYKAKLSYYFTKNLGASVGYYYNSYTPDIIPETSHDALTLGLTCKF